MRRRKKAFARELCAFRERPRDLSAASAYYRLTEGRERENADAMLASANSEIAVRLNKNKDIVLRNRKLSASPSDVSERKNPSAVE